MKQEMHPSNQMFQSLIGKTVSAVEYVDDFDEGITLRFTDGSFLCVAEEMQAGRIQVAASINEAEPPEDVYYLDGDQLARLNEISDCTAAAMPCATSVTSCGLCSIKWRRTSEHQVQRLDKLRHVARAP
jgi:hypothetical protein